MQHLKHPLTKNLPRRDFLKRVSGATAAVAATAALKPRLFGQAPSANVVGAAVFQFCIAEEYRQLFPGLLILL